MVCDQWLVTNKNRRTERGRVTRILLCDNKPMKDFLSFLEEILQGSRNT